MNTYLLYLALSYFFILTCLYIVEQKISNRDAFSPGNIFIYFSALSGLPLLWFSTNTKAIDELIFANLDSQYHQINLAYRAYVYTIIGMLISYIGIVLGNKVSHPLLNYFFSKALPLKAFQGQYVPQKSVTRARNRGGIVFLVGIFVYLIFIQKMGGITDLWENLHERVERASGLGYLQTFYSYSIVFGALLIIYASILKRRFLFSAAITILTIFILASLGQRGPVAEFIFAIIVIYHYKIRSINNILTIKTMSIAAIFIIFMLLSVQFRTAGAIEKYRAEPAELFADAQSSFERHVIARFGRLERDIAILGYFDQHNIWWGASYYSLITAPIPRSTYPDKPPVDTGRYLLAIAEGAVIIPPVPVSELPPSSWPDANWAGYMNFYIPGFIAAYLLSGFILGFTFQHVRYRNYSIAAVVFYSMFSWGGCPTVSPMGLVSIATDIGMLLIWCYFFIVFRSRNRDRTK